MTPGMWITKFIVQETGRFHDQWRRPYFTVYDDRVRGVLDEKLSTVQHFNPATVASTASTFIQVQSQPEKLLDIPNGWGERRFRYMLELMVVDQFGNKNIETLNGYSSYFDVSLNGSLPEDLEFDINSIIVVKETLQYTPAGPQVNRQVIDNSHLLFNKNSPGLAGPNDLYLRPMDIYGRMAVHDSEPVIRKSGSVYDASITMAKKPVKSNRSNALATNYMAKLLQSYNSAHRTTSLDQDERNVYDIAAENVSESLVTTDHFLQAIQKIRGWPLPGSTFTLRDLRLIDPAAIEDKTRTRCFTFNDVERSMSDMRQNSQVWSDVREETLVATMLAQSVPSLMMELFFTGIRFTATNRNLGIGTTFLKHDTVSVGGYAAFTQMEMSQHLTVFEERCANEIMRWISRNGEIDYYVEVTIDMLEHAEIKVSIYGRPLEPFVVPMFADAKFAPFTTDQQLRIDGIVSDVGYMQEQLITPRYETGHMEFKSSNLF